MAPPEVISKQAVRRRRSVLVPPDKLRAHAEFFPHAFDRDATMVLYAVRSVAQSINDYANDWLSPLKLNASKYNHLAIIYFSGEAGLTLNELSGLVHTTNAAVGSMVATLEKDGLIRRDANPNDGRSVLIRLTRRGKELFERAVPVHYRNIRAGTSKLSSSESAMLVRLLEKLMAGFDEECGGA